MQTPFQRAQLTFARLRAWAVARPGGRTTWRVFIAVCGGLVVAAGLIMIPFPGPGWLVVFLGIGIWATEFVWAQHLLAWTKARVTTATAWMLARPAWQRVTGGVLALGFTAVVIAGLAAYQGWFGLSWPRRFGGLGQVRWPEHFVPGD